VSQHAGATSSEALVHGYAVTTGCAAALLVVVAVVSGLLIATSPTPSAATSPATSNQKEGQPS